MGRCGDCAKHDANNVLIDATVLDSVWEKAAESERKRMHFDLRTSQKDTSQRILNALLPGTVVPVHRHRDTAETILVVSGRLTVVLYDEDGRECARHDLNPKEGRYGLQVAKGQWHTVTVDEPCVIFEAMDGCYAPQAAEDMRNV